MLGWISWHAGQHGCSTISMQPPTLHKILFVQFATPCARWNGMESSGQFERCHPPSCRLDASVWVWLCSELCHGCVWSIVKLLSTISQGIFNWAHSDTSQRVAPGFALMIDRCLVRSLLQVRAPKVGVPMNSTLEILKCTCPAMCIWFWKHRFSWHEFRFIRC